MFSWDKAMHGMTILFQVHIYIYIYNAECCCSCLCICHMACILTLNRSTILLVGARRGSPSCGSPNYLMESNNCCERIDSQTRSILSRSTQQYQVAEGCITLFGCFGIDCQQRLYYSAKCYSEICSKRMIGSFVMVNHYN